LMLVKSNKLCVGLKPLSQLLTLSIISKL